MDMDDAVQDVVREAMLRGFTLKGLVNAVWIEWTARRNAEIDEILKGKAEGKADEG